ncbi:MAG: pitrilysin family protein [Desulfobaccales bacterium]
MYRKSVLPNGVRLVTEELPHFHSVAVGFWLTVGGRDETEAEHGLSHFLEHMAFKGTARRDALAIAREADRLGGSVNAFTTKECTCYHARVLAEHLPVALDLLTDLVLQPAYREEDLERERQVILEEIAAQEDSPEDLVQVEFARRFWPGQALGRPLLGDAEDVLRVRREDLLRYRSATYRPEQLLVAVTGRLSHEEVLDLAGPALAAFANGAPPRQREPAAAVPGTHLIPRDLEQVHVCLGTEGLAAADPRRFTATVLQTILGGNMSSRLFQVIREQLGLAYTIYSFLSFLSDTGVWEIAAGVSPKHLPALLQAVSRELRRLKEEGVSDTELAAAKEYLRGSIYLHAEEVEQRMLRLAKNEIHFGDYIPIEDVVAGLNRVTAAQVQELAREFFRAERWGMALLGPVAEESLDLDF